MRSEKVQYTVWSARNHTAQIIEMENRRQLKKPMKTIEREKGMGKKRTEQRDKMEIAVLLGGNGGDIVIDDDTHFLAN